MSASPDGVFGPPQNQADAPGQTLMFEREGSSDAHELIIVNPESGAGARLDKVVDVGRAVDCRLRFRDDSFMAHRAARIDPDGPMVLPADEDAFVWIRVRSSTPLRAGDELLVGSTHLIVSAREEVCDDDPSPRN